MAFLSKNLVKSISNLRHVSNTCSLYIPKRHHIFKTAGGAAEEKYSSNHRVLVRRFRCSGLDESRYLSDLSHKNFSPITQLSSRISEGLAPWDTRFFCGSATCHFSALSCENHVSPIQNLNFPSFHEYTFLGSCGGVVCLDDDREGALFWNPSTNESKLLPRSEVDRPDPAAEPKRIIKTYTTLSGFGFDSKSQDYKYVRWVTFFFREEDECCDDYYTLVELYSLRTDSWKHIPCPRGRGIRDFSACVNGDFYWSTHWKSPTEIMKFDFATEYFSYLPFPHTGKPIGNTYDFNLFDFRGSVGVVVYPRKLGLAEKSFELWVWNGGWWAKEFDDRVKGAERPLGFSKNGQFLFLVGIERQLLVYDVGTKELKQVDIYCNPHVLNLIPYVESMLPLNAHGENTREEDLPNYYNYY